MGSSGVATNYEPWTPLFGRPQEFSLLALMPTILWFYHSSLPNILTAYMYALFTSEYVLYFRAFMIGGN